MRTRRDGSLWIALLGAFVVLAAIPAVATAQGVVVDATVSGNPVAGGTLQGKAAITIKDKSKFQKIEWIQKAGLPATIVPVAAKEKAKKDQKLTRTANITLGPASTYKHHLIESLYEPPIDPSDLPPNVPVPPGEFTAGLQDRWQVVGLNPLALEETGYVSIQVKVTTSSGAWYDMLTIHTDYGYGTTAGIDNVPVNQRVLLQGREQATYDWTLEGPPGSTAVLEGANTQNPSFVPNAPGNYILRVTELPYSDIEGNPEPGGPVSFTVYAGEWRGVIVGQDANGRPVADDACTVCHSGRFAPDKFTPWAETGHAEIFTDQVEALGHYGEGCLSCHTVGYDKARANDGIDEAEDWNEFIASGLLTHGAPGNWQMIIDDYPEVAAKANIQCENCHGPQEFWDNVDSNAHGVNEGLEGSPRITFSSDNCAQCHGEPPRHGRFQQWQFSKHANYETAELEGTNPNCSRCHSAQGFVAWMPRLLDDDLTNDNQNVTVTWDVDSVHPVTCQACHDPHAIGTTTGVTTNATVRISGDSPKTVSGYQAIAVGAGALCITCHNSRRPLRNDSMAYNWTNAGQAPHLGDQGDVLMGENGFFVQAGVRGRHSFIEDTCVNCHMEKTPPPADLSYQLGGTNHTFYARPEVCDECHVGLDAENLQHSFEAVLHDLESLIIKKFDARIKDYLSKGWTLQVNSTIISNYNDIAGYELTESHGAQELIIILKNGTHIEGPLGTSGTSFTDRLTVNKPADQGGRVYFYFAEKTDEGAKLPKAFWNFLLVEADGSLGVHNPTWVLTVLQNSRIALGGGQDGAPKLTALDLAVTMK